MGGQQATGLQWETIVGNNPFLLHVAVQSVVQIYIEVEEPETSENLTQSFEIHYVFQRRTQLLAVISIQDSRRSIRSVLEYLPKAVCASPLRYIHCKH